MHFCPIRNSTSTRRLDSVWTHFSPSPAAAPTRGPTLAPPLIPPLHQRAAASPQTPHQFPPNPSISFPLQDDGRKFELRSEREQNGAAIRPPKLPRLQEERSTSPFGSDQEQPAQNEGSILRQVSDQCEGDKHFVSIAISWSIVFGLTLG